MKRLLGLILLVGLIYGGYLYYQNLGNDHSSRATTPVKSGSGLIISQTSDSLTNLASVLGASISNTYENGKELLNTATSGASEPIINELVSNTTEALKDLPRREAEKIKYEFCRGIVEDYENKSTSN